jgi:hypothetical protein
MLNKLQALRHRGYRDLYQMQPYHNPAKYMSENVRFSTRKMMTLINRYRQMEELVAVELERKSDKSYSEACPAV